MSKKKKKSSSPGGKRREGGGGSPAGSAKGLGNPKRKAAKKSAAPEAPTQVDNFTVSH